MAARFAQGLRLFSTNSASFSINKNAVGGRYLVEKVAVTDNGKTVVGWHPEAPIPYESTKPIERTLTPSATLLKDAALETAMRAFKDKHPEVARQELMRLTHTTKHRWYPRSRDKKAKTDTPMDRPYL